MESGNLHKHLYKKHPNKYNKVAAEWGWTNKWQQQTEDTFIQTTV